MNRRWIVLVFVIGMTAMVYSACSKNSSPTQPQQQPTVTKLVAAPPSVTVGAGISMDVAVSGGTPPYSVTTAPSAIATAQLLNPDSAISIIHITGVSVATASTAVTIKDNSAASAKTVTIPIGVH
jgi:hypothetical protein